MHKKAPKFWSRTGLTKVINLKANGVIMEQEIVVSQFTDSKRIKKINISNFNWIKNHPALDVGVLIIGGFFVLAVSMGIALASVRFAETNFEPEPVSIISPTYKVTDLDLGRYNDCTLDCTAIIWTDDEQFSIEVVFDYTSLKNGNGYVSWREIDIMRLEPKTIHDKDGFVINAYIDRYEIANINNALIKAIDEKLGG